MPSPSSRTIRSTSLFLSCASACSRRAQRHRRCSHHPRRLAMNLNLDIDSLPPEQAETALTRLEAIKAQRAVENALAHYVPYPRQEQFHNAGATHRERLLIAANQSGKSLAGGMECAMHATGRYPDWWRGRRFDKPTIGWGAGTTNETTRDTVQRILVGRPGQQGTGAIPKDAILELVSARGTPDLLDSIKVRHVSDGVSVIGLKSYQRGHESFQGETLDYLWFDEEPPADIFTEGLTRTNVNQGPVWVTFTPLLGMSETVRRFLLEKSPDRHVTTMTLDDVDHFTAEEKAKIAASYSAHEREAHERRANTGFWPHLARRRRNARLRAMRFPEILATHRWDGFRMGSPVRGGRIGLGQRYRHRLRHEMLSRPRGNRRHSRGSAQIVGQGSAVGVATGWPTRDVGRRRQAACGSIPSAGPRDAARTCAIRGRIGVGRGRHCGHAHSDGGRALQGVEALE